MVIATKPIQKSNSIVNLERSTIRITQKLAIEWFWTPT